MKDAGRILSALLLGVLAFHPGRLPQPAAIDGDIVMIAAPLPSKVAPVSSKIGGGGRIGGPSTKKDGLVSGTGRRAAGAHIGGK
jgi:hypothetical protein